MLIERTSTEVIIRIPASVNTEELQDVVDFIRYKEITSKFDVSQKEANKLAAQVKKNWWSKNKKRFVSE